MTVYKKLSLVGVLAAFFLSAVAIAGIGENINWLDKNCFQIGPIKSCKPSTNWDTQKTRDFNAKYKFVLHRPGFNPNCWIRFDDNPKGKTAHVYAKWLKARLKQRGITNLSQRKQVIAGRNVSFIGGDDSAKGSRYLVGVWRNKDVGINFECQAAIKDFGTYEPQFMSFITNARIVSERAY